MEPELREETLTRLRTIYRRQRRTSLPSHPEAAAASGSLIEFAKYVRHGHYMTPWHLVELAGILEAVARREKLRVIVNMPPQHGKSLLTTELFPAWHLGHRPDDPIMLISYGQDRANKSSRRVRNIIASERFRACFPGISINHESRAVHDWELAQHDGGVKAAGIGGAITGFGAGLLIIDDPHKNRDEAESDTLRDRVGEFYKSDAYTRLRPDGAVLLIQTRWHEDDLTGRLLADEGIDEHADTWEVVQFPALDEDEKPLWPERYPLRRYQSIRATLGPYNWEALYQGRPTAPEGAEFKRDWFKIEDRAPSNLQWVRGWDLAASSRETADYTVGVRCALDADGVLWIDDVFRARQEWPKTLSDMRALATVDYGEAWAIETAGFQLSAFQQLISDPQFAGVAISEVKADRDKVARARGWQSRAAAGRLRLVRGEWCQQFIAECLSFPLGKHDDQVDGVSIAWQALADYQRPFVMSLEDWSTV